MEAAQHEEFHESLREDRASERSEFETTDITHSEKGGKSSSTKMMAFGGILLVLGVAATAAAAIAIARQPASPDTKDEAEEQPIASDDSSGGGNSGVDVPPDTVTDEPVAPAQTASPKPQPFPTELLSTNPFETESTPPPTSTTRPPVTVPSNAILCTLGFHKQNFIPDRYPPDGVCHILVLHVEVRNTTVYSRRKLEFYEMAKMANQTLYGLDIANENVSLVEAALYEPRVIGALRPPWYAGVSYFGRLNNVISSETSLEDIASTNILLLGLRNTMEQYARSEIYRKHFVFVGVTAVFQKRDAGTMSPSLPSEDEEETKVTERFRELIKGIDPLVVVYNIVYDRPHMSPSMCMATGPTVFQQAPLDDQATLDDAIKLHRTLSSVLTYTTRTMFSMTPCGRTSIFSPLGNATLGIGDPCLNSSLTLVNQSVCSGDMYSNMMDKMRHIATSQANDGSHMVSYETMATVSWKMCHVNSRALVKSWAIFGVDCSPESGFCAQDDYEFPRFVMNETGNLPPSCVAPS